MIIDSLLTTYRGNALMLEGNNFSGRTGLLCRCVAEKRQQGATYLGSSVHRYISSLMPTVHDELHIHLSGARHEKLLFSLAESFGLAHRFSQSPFTLSGGEQALLTIFSKLGLEPAVLALDSTLGELDQVNKARIANVFSSAAAENTATLLTESGYVEDCVDNFPNHRPISDFVKPSANPPRFVASNFRFLPAVQMGCLEAEEIYFGYTADTLVLRGASFQLQPGHIYSFEGRNGAGKSTLAQILVGALPLERGRISFDGCAFNPWRNPGSVVSMHMQNPDFQLFANSVYKEVSDLPDFSSEFAAKLAGVENLLTEHPFDLPFVLRKRLTFSIIAHLRRPWFIFDEPTLGQDVQTCDQMVMIFQKMAKNGAGIIVISHSREFIRRLEPKRLWLEDGLIKEL